MTTRAQATIDDLYQVKGKAELVNGEIVVMEPTGFWPGRAAGAIMHSLLQSLPWKREAKEITVHVQSERWRRNGETISQPVRSVSGMWICSATMSFDPTTQAIPTTRSSSVEAILPMRATPCRVGRCPSRNSCRTPSHNSSPVPELNTQILR